MLCGVGLQVVSGQREILRGVNIAVSPGEAVAIIGPSGAGKSSLLKTLGGILHASAGHLSFEDTEYGGNGGKEPTVGDFWPHVTVVFQQLFLWPHMTLEENICLPLLSSRTPDAAEDIARSLAARLGLGHVLRQYPNEVSLGERQRAAIARGLAVRPRYLLLDEVTSALDVEHVGRLVDLLRDELKRGAGLVFATHLLGFARVLADRVLFMDEGAIEEEGPSEILRSPKTERLKRFLALVEYDGSTS